jgi:TolA-binding protein
MKYLFLIIFSISSICAKAQKHDYSQYPSVNMQRGMELYDEKKFNAAIAQFQLYLEQSPDSEITKSEAQYYLALSKLLANNSDGEPSVLSFLEKNPGSHKTHMANLALGNHYYEQKRYSTARRYYKSVDKLAIPKDDRTQYYYRLGYSQVVTKKYDRAYETLKPLTKLSSEYKILATYYFGYCAYQKGSFKEALRSFKSIEDNGPKDVKVYIAQIQYAQGEYTRCLATLERLSHRKNDALTLLKGKCYYRLDNLSKASEYFVKTKYTPEDLGNTEKYEFGYSYYKSRQYQRAVKWLRPIGFQGDSLSQHAAYTLGMANLKLSKKREALNAFAEAYRASFDYSIAESALFNQAKLAVELEDNNSNTLLQRFIDNYPDSKYSREAKKLLTKQMLNTDNYKEAVRVLESLGNMDSQEKEIYQRVTLARAMELFKGRRWNEANAMFDKCMKQKTNQLASEATFWKAESYTNQEKHKGAANLYQSYMNTGDSKEEIYPLAYYGYGYTQYSQKKHAVAAPYFKKFIENLGQGNYADRLINDAYLRMGDCYFASREYAQAINSYAYTTGKKAIDADYALYQTGILYGLQKKYDEKISVMRRLISEHSSSRYIPEAYYELGAEYWVKGNYPEAEKNFMYLVDDFKGHSLVVRCYSNLGRIYESTDGSAKALEMYTRLFDEYPGTAEARTAAEQVKRLYAGQGEPEKYVDWYMSRGGKVTASEKDSLLYNSAFDFYDIDNCDKAIVGFGKYLKEIPNGGFVVIANYYKAICHEKLGQDTSAIKHYQKVAEASSNEFQEDAILALLELFGDEASCKDVFTYLEKIEGITKNRDTRHKSWQGMMRCYDEDSNAISVRDIAQRILNELSSPDDLKAEGLVKMGKWDYHEGKNDEASKKFKEVIEKYNNQYTAEAKYREAQILLDQKEYTACQDACYEVLDYYSAYDYWLGKSMNLLGHAYLESGDEFNAKATWQSVIENFTEEQIVEEAKSNLDELK